MSTTLRKIDIGTTNYTEVYAEGEREFSANHEYLIGPVDSTVEYARIKFQRGPIKENGINGCHNEDLIAIVIDRLQSFQESEYKCRENAIAITKLEEALMWLRKRTEDRQKRGVEGTSNL